MNDAQVGSVFRMVRIRRGLSQAQVAGIAGVSRPTVSVIERGALDATSIRMIRKVASVLGVSVALEPMWRGAELAKLSDDRHAALVKTVVVRLTAAGWQAIPEHTFNEWGENGSIDVLAWHPATRAVLAVEVKTALPDLQDLLSTTNRKRRLAPKLARDQGWRPLVVGSVPVLPAETWARHAVESFGPIFAAAFPARGLEVRRWLRKPDLDLRGFWFLLNDSPGSTKRRPGGSMRVRPQKPAVSTALPRSGFGRELLGTASGYGSGS